MGNQWGLGLGGQWGTSHGYPVGRGLGRGGGGDGEGAWRANGGTLLRFDARFKTMNHNSTLHLFLYGGTGIQWATNGDQWESNGERMGGGQWGTNREHKGDACLT